MPNESSRQSLLAAIQQVNPLTFDELALDIFHYQARYNPLYAQYLRLLSLDVSQISSIASIPFLPISLFKTHTIKSGEWESSLIFQSSGTTGSINSAHHLRDPDWYLQNCELAFGHHYGDFKKYCFLALLPSYLEREDSSLVFMANHFIQSSDYQQSDFFLHDQEALFKTLIDCQNLQIPTVLLGVSFALLDLAEHYPMDLSNIIIMETGGMKGRRRELTRAGLHEQLKTAFQAEAIHSEYGMTELLSQAYSKNDGLFHPAPTMKLCSRELTDPLTIQKLGKKGPLNIIDLANLDTCSFIATDDLGQVHANGSFEVLGRIDNSDMRGCNLMVA